MLSASGANGLRFQLCAWAATRSWSTDQKASGWLDSYPSGGQLPRHRRRLTAGRPAQAASGDALGLWLSAREAALPG